jgi:hypothetical protein
MALTLLQGFEDQGYPKKVLGAMDICEGAPTCTSPGIVVICEMSTFGAVPKVTCISRMNLGPAAAARGT